MLISLSLIDTFYDNSKWIRVSINYKSPSMIVVEKADGTKGNAIL
jgi:hypothetical protein